MGSATTLVARAPERSPTLSTHPAFTLTPKTCPPRPAASAALSPPQPVVLAVAPARPFPARPPSALSPPLLLPRVTASSSPPLPSAPHASSAAVPPRPPHSSPLLSLSSLSL